ncbi:MAG: fused MFS/spermidine synthase [Rhodoferax sp.]|nr:fused MFS/spermidine synthase [Rhodoferax sp.]MDP3651648.1 fused MFS/spermidine synthase [Rhodoferax sp.]
MPDFLEALQHARPFVSADADTVSLYFHASELQSRMSVQHPNRLEVPYTKTMMGFLLLKPHPAHILMIGLGGGSLAKFCYHHLPSTRITVVEINPHVIALRQRFQVPEDGARFSVLCADGADWLHAARQSFDVILVDGFDVRGQPSQLSSRAFYEDCYRSLLPKGVMLVNTDAEHAEHTVLLQRVYKTYHGHFVEVGVPERSNHIVFAAKGMPISARAMSLSWTLGHHPDEVQAQLKTEFQRILQLLDGLEPLGRRIDQRNPLHLH